MYHQNGQPIYPPNGSYQQQSSHMPRPFQQQQFGPRFETPQQFTQPGTYYQSPQQQRAPYQGPVVQPQQFYPPAVQNQIAVQNVETLPNSQYSSLSTGPGFNQMPIPPYRPPVTMYKPNQNYTQPLLPPVQIVNQPPVQNFNNCPSIQNYNQPSPIQNYNQPVIPPCQPVSPNINPYQSSSPRYGLTSNTSYQPQVQCPEPIKQQSYQSPAGQCYQQQQSLFNVQRHGFNPRPQFSPPEQQRFHYKNQNPRYQQSQRGNNRFPFNPRQQYQNNRPRGPLLSFNDHPTGSNNVHKRDQIACKMGDCDFVGHAGAVKEHQNLHHRLGLHKKVLYSNNSDAVKNWIEERKK